MSEGLNRWLGMGNLGATAETRAGQSGVTVVTFRLACNERYKDKSDTWQERVVFVPCVWFGKRAEACAHLLTKGASVFVEARFNVRSYEKDGATKWVSEMVVQNVVLTGSAARDGDPVGDG